MEERETIKAAGELTQTLAFMVTKRNGTVWTCCMLCGSLQSLRVCVCVCMFLNIKGFLSIVCSKGPQWGITRMFVTIPEAFLYLFFLWRWFCSSMNVPWVTTGFLVIQSFSAISLCMSKHGKAKCKLRKLKMELWHLIMLEKAKPCTACVCPALLFWNVI